jgi:antitoxin component HigA of HigAB toxin-antitoxin module
MDRIINEIEYNKALEAVNLLMQKGEANITPNEAETIEAMAKEIQVYEKARYPCPIPKIFADTIELKKIESIELTSILKEIDTLKNRL